MKRCLFCLTCLGIIAAATSLAVAQKAPKARPKPVPQAEPAAPTLEIGQGYSYGNLTLFPISSLQQGEDRFTTLDEGLKEGTVEVREVGATTGEAPRGRGGNQRDRRQDDDRDPFGSEGNDVNRLIVINKSKKPLYLMPGEILLGGDQDRTVGEELVVAPDGKPHEVEVFCVEQGRWGQREAAELRGYIETANASSSGAAAISQIPNPVKEANSGKFIGSVGSLNKAGRVAVQQGKNQGKVWDEVAKENGKGGVKSKSGAFTGNYAEKEAVKRLEPYVEKLQQPVADTKNVVGVIVAVNGRPESIDVFESTPLFNKLWPKLLKSYALDAVNASDERSKGTCSHDKAVAFLKDVEASQVKETSGKKDVKTTLAESEKVLLFTARHGRQGAGRPASPSAMGGMGGFGGAIHGAGYAK